MKVIVCFHKDNFFSKLFKDITTMETYFNNCKIEKRFPLASDGNQIWDISEPYSDSPDYYAKYYTVM